MLDNLSEQRLYCSTSIRTISHQCAQTCVLSKCRQKQTISDTIHTGDDFLGCELSERVLLKPTQTLPTDHKSRSYMDDTSHAHHESEFSSCFFAKIFCHTNRIRVEVPLCLTWCQPWMWLFFLMALSCLDRNRSLPNGSAFRSSKRIPFQLEMLDSGSARQIT